MKSINMILQKCADRHNKYKILLKFLETKRGKSFVNSLYTASLPELYKRFQVPRAVRILNINEIHYALFKLNLAEQKYKTGGKYQYTVKKDIVKPNVVCMQKKPIGRYLLSKKEFNEIESRRPKKWGLAAKMHAYEEHKMLRYEKRNKFPEEKEIKLDLFPSEIEGSIRTSRFLHREYVRNFLSKVYCNTIRKEYYYRLFGVYENNATNRVYEKEMDPMVVGYPFTPYYDEAPIIRLHERLRKTASSVKQRDTECLEVKLYNKYGKFIASARCA